MATHFTPFMKDSEKYTQLVNCKKVLYGNGNVEYRFYNRPIKIGIEKEIDKPCYIEFDGVQFNTDSGEIRSEKSINHSIKSSLSRTINTIYELASSNTWDWFLTFTFDSKKVDRYNYDECLSKLCKFFNNFKTKKCDELKYICVPEYHKDGAIHFHGLLSGVPDVFFVDSGVIENGLIVYNFIPYKLGFSTATRVSDTFRVSTYITKYITKDLVVNTSRKRYICSKNLNRAVVESEYIPPDELVRIKTELITQGNYFKELKIDNINQIITYVHILCGSEAT